SVDESWIASEGLTAETVRMYRWDGIKWNELETRIISKGPTSTNFEAKTTEFSHFAISGIKGAAIQTTPSITAPAPSGTPAGTAAVTETPGKAATSAINLFIIIGVFIVILAVIVLYFVRKK
ncbi:MAG: PGF-pre-PGF domain-containing protein, partial [Candidatus Methanoperedens sp.]|nr:PGF-pre-PGF domain-containing protein [Candidatus Methanoperedens sp.]